MLSLLRCFKCQLSERWTEGFIYHWTMIYEIFINQTWSLTISFMYMVHSDYRHTLSLLTFPHLSSSLYQMYILIRCAIIIFALFSDQLTLTKNSMWLRHRTVLWESNITFEPKNVQYYSSVLTYTSSPSVINRLAPDWLQSSCHASKSNIFLCFFKYHEPCKFMVP